MNTLPKTSASLLSPKGMTLMEITITIAIFVIVVMIGGDYIINAFGALQFGTEQADAIASARKAMDDLKGNIREARVSDRGDYALALAGAQNFTFYSDIDNDRQAEKIAYYVSSSTLMRTVTEPGAASNYPGPAATTTIARYINNQSEPVFIYFDDNGSSTSIINRIRLVNVRLKVNVTPLVAPADYYVETDIQLRNLKDNL